MKRKLISRDDTDIEQPSSGWSSDVNDFAARKTSRPSSNRRYHHSASIVFLGPRATGTSSLAVIAASILGWNVVDCDREFDNRLGSTKQQYRTEHGAQQYRLKKLEVVQDLLQDYPEHHVFACGTIIPRSEKDFLWAYTAQHPVIYVIREEALVRQCLALADDEPWHNALEQIHQFFRHRSNFEFFNIDEAQEPLWQNNLCDFLNEKSQDISRHTKARVLRQTRRHVLKLLHNIYGPAFDVRYHGDTKLSQSTPDLRAGSFVLQLDLEDVRNNPRRLDSIDTDIDAVQLNLESNAETCQLLLTSDILPWVTSLIRRKLDVPIVININFASASNFRTSSSVRHYRQLLQHALRPAPEFLTIDLRAEDDFISDIIAIKGHTKVVGCLYHSMAETMPWNSVEDMLKTHDRAKVLGCDMLSVHGHATNLDDNIKLQEVVRRVGQSRCSMPSVFINRGSHGRLSQVLNKTMTPVVAVQPEGSFPTSDQRSTTHFTTAQQLRIIRQSLVQNQRTRFYVIGAEVKESLSPALHSAAFKACGVPYAYEAYETNDLASLARFASSASFGGASIAFPFKPQVLSLASSHSVAVELIGAANTLLPCSEKQIGLQSTDQAPQGRRHQLVAENTDWTGIYVCIAKHTTPANHITRDTSAVVIGAGGIARAAIYALMKLGVGHITILNRTAQNAVKLKDHFESICNRDSDASSSDSSSDSKTTSNAPDFHICDGWNTPWPEDVPLPSIIICTIPVVDAAASTEYPPEIRLDWLKNTTGGLIADVSVVILLQHSNHCPTTH